MKQEGPSSWDRESLKNPHRQADKARRVRQMFSGIAGRYDLLNHLLSFNQDRRWRRRAVRRAEPRAGQRVLDLCCGTGDLAWEFVRQNPALGQVIGLDFAEPMLHRAAQKGPRRGAPARGSRGNEAPVKWICGDAQRLPLAEGSCDAAACAFGLRNLEDPGKALEELHRVLKPGGRLVILEFAWPKNGVISWLYQGYFRLVLPVIGNIIAQDRNRAYHYLPASVKSFATEVQLETRLRESGFKVMHREEWACAAVLVLVAGKP